MTESQQSYNFLYKSDAKGTLETLKRHINEIESQIARLQSDRSTDKLDNIGSTNNTIQMYIIIFINLYFLLLCKNIKNFNEIEVNKIKEVLPSIDDFINDYKKNNLNYYDNIEENIKNISTIAKEDAKSSTTAKKGATSPSTIAKKDTTSPSTIAKKDATSPSTTAKKDATPSTIVYTCVD